MGALGKIGWSLGLPHSHGVVLPRCPHIWDHSLLTGLHHLYEVGKENIPVPLTEATDVIGDLEEGDIRGCVGLRLG